MGPRGDDRPRGAGQSKGGSRATRLSAEKQPSPAQSGERVPKAASLEMLITWSLDQLLAEAPPPSVVIATEAAVLCLHITMATA
jgi:hypothetical protein